MGPCVSRRELCGTCNHGASDCTGHFGYIELELTCYNPFFIKTAATILKSICSKCKKIQLTARMKEIIELQLKLIDAGYVTEASDLEDQKIIFCNASKVSFQKKLDDDGDSEAAKQKREKTYIKTVKNYRKLLVADPINHFNQKTKTSEGLRNSIIHR